MNTISISCDDRELEARVLECQATLARAKKSRFRRNWLMSAVQALAALSVGWMLGWTAFSPHGAVGQANGEPPAALSARQVVVRDAAGRLRMLIAAEEEVIGIVLFDEQDLVRATFVVNSDQPTVALAGTGYKYAAWQLSVSPQHSACLINGKGDHQAFLMAVIEDQQVGVPQFRLFDAQGARVFSFSPDVLGNGGMNVYDRQGTQHVFAGSLDDGAVLAVNAVNPQLATVVKGEGPGGRVVLGKPQGEGGVWPVDLYCTELGGDLWLGVGNENRVGIGTTAGPAGNFGVIGKDRTLNAHLVGGVQDSGRLELRGPRDRKLGFLGKQEGNLDGLFAVYASQGLGGVGLFVDPDSGNGDGLALDAQQERAGEFR